jgi:hypothetical protein
MAQPTVSRWVRGALAVKVETTYGVDATPANTDVIFARNIAFRVLQGQVRDDRIGGLVATLPDIPGTRAAQTAAESFLRGFGAAYSAGNKPEVDALLRALGFSSTGSFTGGAEKYTYVPQSGSTMGESVTVQFVVENAPTGKPLGCFGTGKISARAGENGIFAYTLTGLYQEPADVAMINASVPTVQIPQFKAGIVTIGGTTFKVSGFDLDFGNDIQLVPSANDAQGYGECIIANRRIQLIVDPEAVSAATFNFHNKRDTASLLAASWQIGSAQYNRIKFSAPKLQIIDIQEVQRQGLRAYQLTCLCAASAGGDDLSIVFD